MNGNKLKAKIVEKGLSVTRFASLINMDRSSLYRKLSNSQRITISEATRIKEALEMTNEEAATIFFG
jgi:plasmid maintenance system antidote protein VapI